MIKHSGMIGTSSAMQRVFEVMEKAARVDMPVLIEGETGTGKELVARLIHDMSARGSEPFVAVNTGAISRELVAGELFGHKRGAFTGATEDREGRFAEADKGTLFLDEIATMEERVQVTLLRVLESGTFRPVGAANDCHSDVRIIAAANVSLESAVKDGYFRRDLLHRLGVFRITLPPLRKRASDIPEMVEVFMGDVRDKYGLDVEGITPQALNQLCQYAWPGNVRELKGVIAHACVVAAPGPIDVEHLPVHIVEATTKPVEAPVRQPRTATAPMAATARKPALAAVGAGGGHFEHEEGAFLPLGASLEEVQKVYTLKILQHCGNNKSRAAQVLSVSRKTLYDMLVRWGCN